MSLQKKNPFEGVEVHLKSKLQIPKLREKRIHSKEFNTVFKDKILEGFANPKEKEEGKFEGISTSQTLKLQNVMRQFDEGGNQNSFSIIDILEKPKPQETLNTEEDNDSDDSSCEKDLEKEKKTQQIKKSKEQMISVERIPVNMRSLSSLKTKKLTIVRKFHDFAQKFSPPYSEREGNSDTDPNAARISRPRVEKTGDSEEKEIKETPFLPLIQGKIRKGKGTERISPERTGSEAQFKKSKLPYGSEALFPSLKYRIKSMSNLHSFKKNRLPFTGREVYDMHFSKPSSETKRKNKSKSPDHSRSHQKQKSLKIKKIDKINNLQSEMQTKTEPIPLSQLQNWVKKSEDDKINTPDGDVGDLGEYVGSKKREEEKNEIVSVGGYIESERSKMLRKRQIAIKERIMKERKKARQREAERQKERESQIATQLQSQKPNSMDATNPISEYVNIADRQIEFSNDGMIILGPPKVEHKSKQPLKLKQKIFRTIPNPRDNYKLKVHQFNPNILPRNLQTQQIDFDKLLEIYINTELRKPFKI